MINRYNVLKECRLVESDNGQFVLYGDHVADLQDVVAIKDNTIEKLREEVKLLQEERDMLSGDITDYQYIIKKLRKG